MEVWCARRDKIQDDEVRHMTKGVNGPLLDLLSIKSEHADRWAVDLFRKGAPIVGELTRYHFIDSSVV